MEKKVIQVDRIRQAFYTSYPNRLVTVDSHTQGEPTRLIVSGVGELSGRTMEEKLASFVAEFDHVRLLLTREPRGHRDMVAAALTSPVSDEAHIGLVYMDAQRYPFLCGHATIGAVTTLVELGELPASEGKTVVMVDTPSGPIEAHARVEDGRVISVMIDMVPSFVLGTGYQLDVQGFQTIPLDLVCVGGFFAMVDAQALGLSLIPEKSGQLIDLGMAIIDAANQQLEVHHPDRPEVKTVDVVEFYQEGDVPGQGRSVVVYGESHMDRSPCGTGTSAKMTLLHHKGALKARQEYKNYSPLGTFFRGYVRETQPIGSFPAVIASVEGSAQITGCHSFVVDGRDPFPKGFLL